MRIASVRAIRIKNSRRQDTIRIFVNKASGAAPSGASKGRYEAKDFPRGIDYSVALASKIGKQLIGFNFKKFDDLKKIEKLLPEDFGANPTIALEFAVLNAWAESEKKPLWKLLNPKAKKMPRILANVIGGGAHYKGLGLDVQEILVSPANGAISKDVKKTSEFHKELGRLLFAKEQTDEGAWVPAEPELEKVFELLLKVSGYERGIDFAASQLYENKRYSWSNLWGNSQKLDARKQFDFVLSLIDEYDLFYVEDPFQQEDFASFARLLKKRPDVMVCGDDLTATNLERLKRAIRMKSINAIIIKPNQAGSLIKTKEVFDFAVRNGIKPIVSHRSGETMDATIAQLAFAWQAPFVKFGIAQKERMAKLNELVKIKRSLRTF